MNGLFKQAMLEAKQADGDPRDELLRSAPGDTSPVVDSVLKPEAQSGRQVDPKAKAKMDALRPLGQ